MTVIIFIIIVSVASLVKDDATPVNDQVNVTRDVSLTAIPDNIKDRSPIKDEIAVENEYVCFIIIIIFEYNKISSTRST